MIFSNQLNPYLIGGFLFLTLLFPFCFIDSVRHIPFVGNIGFIEKYSSVAPLKPLIIFKICIVYLVFYLLTGLRLYLALIMLEIDVSYLTAILLSCASMVTRLVSLTPSNVGLMEGFLGGIALIIGMDFQLTFLAVGVERVFDIIVNFLLFYMFARKDQITSKEKLS